MIKTSPDALNIEHKKPGKSLISFAVSSIVEYGVLYRFYKDRSYEMTYLSVKQTSERWGISTRRIQILCGEDRIPGAMRVGSYWAIPSDAEKPKDARLKSGLYIKECNA